MLVAAVGGPAIATVAALLTVLEPVRVKAANSVPMSTGTVPVVVLIWPEINRAVALAEGTETPKPEIDEPGELLPVGNCSSLRPVVPTRSPSSCGSVSHTGSLPLLVKTPLADPIASRVHCGTADPTMRSPRTTVAASASEWLALSSACVPTVLEHPNVLVAAV